MINKCRAIGAKRIDGRDQSTRKKLVSVTICSPQIKLDLATCFSNFTMVIHINVPGLLFRIPYLNCFISETG